MDSLTETWNIVKCPSSISVKGDENMVNPKKHKTHIFSTVALVQGDRHV
jgi:hypothetical protein